MNSGLMIGQTLAIIISICVTVLFGASDELHQFFVPARTASLADLLFDFIGAASGVLIYYKISRSHPRLRTI